jgi:hypothetical protein
MPPEPKTAISTWLWSSIKMATNPVERSSIFDSTLTYRYSLQRCWPDPLLDNRSIEQKVAFMMLNPSRADSERDDPTIRACMQFARTWGYSILEVVNLFAYRTPHPHHLMQASDPMGPDNQQYWLTAAATSQQIILAWGNAGAWQAQDRVALQTLTPHQDKLFCLGLNQSGQPRHPLYVPRNTLPQPFTVLTTP